MLYLLTAFVLCNALPKQKSEVNKERESDLSTTSQPSTDHRPTTTDHRPTTDTTLSSTSQKLNNDRNTVEKATEKKVKVFKVAKEQETVKKTKIRQEIKKLTPLNKNKPEAEKSASQIKKARSVESISKGIKTNTEERISVPAKLVKAMIPIVNYFLQKIKKPSKQPGDKNVSRNPWGGDGENYCFDWCYVCLDLYDFYCHECVLIDPECNCCY